MIVRHITECTIVDRMESTVLGASNTHDMDKSTLAALIAGLAVIQSLSILSATGGEYW